MQICFHLDPIREVLKRLLSIVSLDQSKGAARPSKPIPLRLVDGCSTASDDAEAMKRGWKMGMDHPFVRGRMDQQSEEWSFTARHRNYHKEENSSRQRSHADLIA
jgi:hypothetical protein